MDLRQLEARLAAVLKSAENCLRSEQLAEMQSVVRAGEPGVALENFRTQLEEYDITLPDSAVRELKALASAMGMKIPPWIERGGACLTAPRVREPRSWACRLEHLARSWSETAAGHAEERELLSDILAVELRRVRVVEGAAAMQPLRGTRGTIVVTSAYGLCARQLSLSIDQQVGGPASDQRRDLQVLAAR